MGAGGRSSGNVWVTPQDHAPKAAPCSAPSSPRSPRLVLAAPPPPPPSTTPATGRSPTACRRSSTALGRPRRLLRPALQRRRALDVLLTLAVAAQRGHHGPARNDRRARRIVRRARRLAAVRREGAAALEGRADARARASSTSMHTIAANQHLVVDAEVVDGLRYAWPRAASSACSTAQAAAIADRIHRTAMGSYWRWPTIRLNQINWYALMYAADATVTGSPRLLRRDLRLQLARFVARARGQRRRRRQLRPRPALPLPAAHPAERADERRLGRVREHRRVVHALLRAGAPRGDARRRRRPPAGCCASG